MDTRTFIIGNKMTLTVPLTAIKSLDIQLAGKGSFVGHVIINAGGPGQLRGRLDGKLLEGTDSTDRDLEEVTRLLVPIVFIDNDPVPLVSLTRLATDGGDDAGSPSAGSVPTIGQFGLTGGAGWRFFPQSLVLVLDSGFFSRGLPEHRLVQSLA